MAILDCMKASEAGEAHINIKIGCCNKKTSKKLKREDSKTLMKLFKLSDDKFIQILEKIDELSNDKKLTTID